MTRTTPSIGALATLASVIGVSVYAGTAQDPSGSDEALRAHAHQQPLARNASLARTHTDAPGAHIFPSIDTLPAQPLVLYSSRSERAIAPAHRSQTTPPMPTPHPDH
ncbi:MAG: hypothetical protein AAGH64_01445 [Planctomycetota bacterium]